MKINLIVIRTENLDLLKSQYELLGMKFENHRHGNGPFHYAYESNGMTFEIYHLTKSMEKADGNLRLGFDVPDLAKVIERLKNTDWIIKSDIQETEWGMTAIVQDLDGRKIELKKE